MNDIAGWAILGVRILLVPFAGYALWLNWRALVELAKGGWSMSQVARAQICFFALAALGGQFFFLIAAFAPALLLSLLLMTGGMALSINLSKRGQEKRLRYGLEKILDRPDLALALVELGEVDPEHADRLAHEAIAALAAAKAGL